MFFKIFVRRPQGQGAQSLRLPNYEVDYAMEYYLNIKFNIANLIAITPAFSYRDYIKNIEGKKEGTDIYGGILATVSYY